MNRKVLITTQIIMTLMMAIMMSGIMSLIAMGPSMDWLRAWPLQALTAWPIAFILTQFAFRFANGIAIKIARGAGWIPG